MLQISPYSHECSHFKPRTGKTEQAETERVVISPTQVVESKDSMGGEKLIQKIDWECSHGWKCKHDDCIFSGQ